MSQEIGKKLKHLRQSKKLTQQEIADKANITRSTISNYEIGRRTPHHNDLLKLAKIFGVGLEYFYMPAKDEAFDLLARAKKVFKNDDISTETKEKLYMEFMKLYLQIKKGEK